MSETIARLHVMVRGRVQGVGFRLYTQQAAEELGLTGWVANRSDRSVEVVAEGPRAALDQFLKSVKRGPSMAQVTDLQHEYLTATREFDEFRVE
jgi:acylphosphatase